MTFQKYSEDDEDVDEPRLPLLHRPRLIMVAGSMFDFSNYSALVIAGLLSSIAAGSQYVGITIDRLGSGDIDELQLGFDHVCELLRLGIEAERVKLAQDRGQSDA